MVPEVTLTIFSTNSTVGPGPGWYVRLLKDADDVLPVTKLSAADVELFVEHGEGAMRGGSTGPLTEAVKEVNGKRRHDRKMRQQELERIRDEAEQALKSIELEED